MMQVVDEMEKKGMAWSEGVVDIVMVMLAQAGEVDLLISFLRRVQHQISSLSSSSSSSSSSSPSAPSALLPLSSLPISKLNLVFHIFRTQLHRNYKSSGVPILGESEEEKKMVEVEEKEQLRIDFNKTENSNKQRTNKRRIRGRG